MQSIQAQLPSGYERIAFLGGGNMARALITGLLRQGWPAQSIAVGEPREMARELFERELGIAAHGDNARAVAGARLVVLAVKPQDAAGVLAQLRESWPQPLPALLSIAAGVRIAGLARACPSGMPIIRAMPNRPALLAAGVTGLYAAPGIGAWARALAEQVISAAGRAVWLGAESEIDIVTAVSGSGPAYFLLLAEQLARAGQSCGLSPETAVLLATETLYGTGLLAHRHATASVAALIEERAAVTSPGGTTEAALGVLQAGGFEPLITRAVQAAATRSAELAAGLAAPRASS